MKKYVGIVAFVLVVSLVVPAVVLASYEYSIPITIYNNNSEALTEVPVLVTLNNSQLVELGYINSSGLDTSLQEGTSSRSYMVGDVRLGLMIPSIDAYQERTYNYRLGESPPQESFSVVVGDGGNVTVSDDADLELGDNFEVEFEGWVDTNSSLDLVKKDGAFHLFTDGGGNVKATINCSFEQIEQTVGDTGVTLYSGAVTRVGERINNFPASTITQVSFKLWANGSPTGTAYIRIRKASDDSILGTIDTIDVSTLTGSSTWYNFTGSVSNPTQQDLRFTVEYSGGDSSNKVIVLYQWNSDVLGGAVYTYYSGSWGDDSSSDVTFKVYFYPDDKEVTASSVSAGEHIINVWADGTNLGIDVDGTTEDSAALEGSSVAGNGNDWFISNLPYLNYYKHTVDGDLEAWYQPNSVVQGTTLVDRSGNGHTGTIIWGSNPEAIEVSVGGLEPYSSYTAAEEGEDAIPEVVPPPTGATGQGLPLYDNFYKAADSLGWTVPTTYVVMFMIIAIVLGFGGMAATKSIWGFVAGFGGTMGFFGAVQDGGGYYIVPFWLTLSCIAFAIFIGYIWRYA